ncbi:MAG: hypothetical protein JSV81_16525 [Anaerolineales bacterium]|nr:MAG: hypothetical protein JSV81_16525 [Anaerolineales bacterium]
MLSSTTETTASTDGAQETRPPAGGQVDLRALAEKIYKLLIEEARLERERLGRHQRR